MDIVCITPPPYSQKILNLDMSNLDIICITPHTHTHTLRENFQLGQSLTGALVDWDKCCPANVFCLRLILYLKVSLCVGFENIL